MPIRAMPRETPTSRKSGLALGKLAPTRTTSTRPLTEILAAPVTASVRDDEFPAGAVALADVPLEPEDLLDPPPPPPAATEEVAGAAETCWTNGSLPVKWLKEKSCALPRRGWTSEVGSFVLAVESDAAAGPGAVVAGAGVPVAGAPVVGAPVVAVVVTAGGVEVALLPPLMTFGTSNASTTARRTAPPTATIFI